MLSGSAINAFTLSFKKRLISPTLVTTTGTPLAKYSPSFVGNPPSACLLLGLARTRISAFLRNFGTSSLPIKPVKTTRFSIFNSFISKSVFCFADSLFKDAINSNVMAGKSFAINANDLIKISTPSFLSSKAPQ